jgi:hypothetical protein
MNQKTAKLLARAASTMRKAEKSFKKAWKKLDHQERVKERQRLKKAKVLHEAPK